MSSKEEPADDINTIQNYSKIPIYTQLYSRKGKEKEKDSNSSNEFNSSIDGNHENLPQMNESIIADNNGLHPEVVVPDKAKHASKQTTPYPISSYMTFSKMTYQYGTFSTTLHYEYIPKNSDEALAHSTNWRTAPRTLYNYHLRKDLLDVDGCLL